MLIAVFLVRAGQRTNLWIFAATMVLVPVALTQIAGLTFGRYGGVFPEAYSEPLLSAAVAKLRSVADDPPEYVIVAEGASWSSRGLAGPVPETELHSKGIDVAVVQVTLPGGNHLERSYLLRTLADSLTSAQLENLSDTNLILLREIARPYDVNPLDQVPDNLFTDRVYAYMSPMQAYTIGRAALKEGTLTPLLAVQLGQHAAFNWLRFSEAQRFETPHRTGTRDGYRPLNETDKAPPIGSISELIAFIESDEEPQYEISAWSDIADSLSEDTYGLPVDRTLRYETPTWKIENNRHARWVASTRRDTTILITDPVLYRNLADVELWYNIGHLRREAAEIYTTLLASRLAEEIHTGQ